MIVNTVLYIIIETLLHFLLYGVEILFIKIYLSFIFFLFLFHTSHVFEKELNICKFEKFVNSATNFFDKSNLRNSVHNLYMSIKVSSLHCELRLMHKILNFEKLYSFFALDAFELHFGKNLTTIVPILFFRVI